MKSILAPLPPSEGDNNSKSGFKEAWVQPHKCWKRSCFQTSMNKYKTMLDKTQHRWRVPPQAGKSHHKAVIVQSTVVQIMTQVPAALDCHPSFSVERRFSSEARRRYLSVENVKLWTINTVTKAGSFISSEVVMRSGKASPLSDMIPNIWKINIWQWDLKTEGCQSSSSTLGLKRRKKMVNNARGQRNKGEILTWFVPIKYRRKIICA